jgi:hypothetical protein
VPLKVRHPERSEAEDIFFSFRSIRAQPKDLADLSESDRSGLQSAFHAVAPPLFTYHTSPASHRSWGIIEVLRLGSAKRVFKTPLALAFAQDDGK